MQKNQTVYLLSHARVGDADEDESAKILGVFSSKEHAQTAIDTHYLKQPGFCDYPHGFTVDEYLLDTLYWREGFGISDDE